MDLGQSIRTGVKWLIIGNTGNRFLEFAFGVVLARLLVPADFGMIITIQVFTGFVSMLSSGGMGQALIRAKKVDHNDFNAVLTLQLAMGILIYTAFYLSAPWFAVYFENPVYEYLLPVSTLVFLMKPFIFMRTSWLTREMDYRKRAITDIISMIATGISSILMAWYGFGVWSLTLSGLVGMLTRNILLARATPLELRLNFDVRIMRRHSTYGSKIIANDFLGNITEKATQLIISKLAGPAFLGLFNKADSLHRLPFWTLGRPVSQTTFRAMSKTQDDLDQTKYMFYRVITLLAVYILPFYSVLWWTAEPFIGLIYGEKWLPASEPLQILTMAGLFYIISRPCGVLLMAQNRLTQEMLAQAVVLVIAVIACLVGLKWGLVGVSWGMLATQVIKTIYFYILAYRTIPTRLTDLAKALAPGLALNCILFLVLLLVDLYSNQFRMTSPAIYILAMATAGLLAYSAAFFLLPIPDLETEVARWREKFGGCLRFMHIQQ